MLLIDKFVDQSLSTEPLTFKAPKRRMYLISSIAFFINVAGANAVHITDYSYEELNAVVDITGSKTIISFPAAALNFFQITDMDHKAKYISIGSATSTTFTGVIYIYGDLIKATRVELLWEWFRKGR